MRGFEVIEQKDKQVLGGPENSALNQESGEVALSPSYPGG